MIAKTSLSRILPNIYNETGSFFALTEIFLREVLFYSICGIFFRFKHKHPEDPSEVPGGFLTDCDKDSMKVCNAFAEVSLRDVKVYDKYQFERLGFFSVDPDTDMSKEKVGNICSDD